MRSTLDIAIAVKECQPATEEELRLAVECLSNINHFLSSTIDKLIEAILEKPALTKLQATFAKDQRERLFQAKKKPMDEWLGPNGIPGSEGQQRGLAMAKNIFKKATGIDLDTPQGEQG